MESEPQPPLPPTSTHPLFKSPTNPQSPAAPPLAYTTETPKLGFFTAQQQQQAKNNAPNASTAAAANPWEREEREKEHEMRREQMRQWRDQQIVELSLLPQRTPQQEEQLKTLVLERDFERRAQEEENEEENEAQYQKNQELIRLQQQQQPSSNSTPTSQISVQTTRLKQVDIKTTPTNISPSSDVPSSTNNDNFQPPPIQPKSILKSSYNSNPSSPSKHHKTTSFAKSQNLTEITMNNTNANQMMTQINKEISELTLEYQTEETTNGPQMPPPPPERGSSFAVMNQKVARGTTNFPKISFNDQMINNNNIAPNKYVPLNNNNEHSPMMMSPTAQFTAQQIQQQMNLINNNSMGFVRDNKRVSFHDHENNNVEIVGEQDMSMIREDPNVS